MSSELSSLIYSYCVGRGGFLRVFKKNFIVLYEVMLVVFDTLNTVIHNNKYYIYRFLFTVLYIYC